MVVAVSFAARAPWPTRALTRQRVRWVFNPLVSCYSANPDSPPPRKLILYSKPGCCLCDGLKEKLHSAFSLSTSDSLHDVDLQIRDISTNLEWEKAYQYEIPVLARVRADGTEEIIPRFSPRVGVELIQKKIAAVLSQEDALEQ